MKDKCVLITGATRGIGWAISQRLADEGAHVVGLGRHVQHIDYPGYLHACDLADAGQTEEQLRVVREKYPIDAVVNNVGVVRPGPIDDLDLAALYEALDMNVRVAVQVVKTFVPGMKSRRQGRIINIGSRTAYGALDRTSYSAAKAAMNGLTRTWALELASFGITVNTVAPGPVDTELFRENHPYGSQAEKAALKAIPMGRLAQPDDVAAAVTFLLREEAGFITGQILGVDGGGSMVGG